MSLPKGLVTGVAARLPGDWKPQETEKPKRRTKYNAVRVEKDGHRFDSKMEAARYDELKILEQAKQIGGLYVHPQFLLQHAIQVGLKVVPAIAWNADFAYWEDGRLIVEDVKGRDTREASLKHKLFKEKFPNYELRIIKTVKR